MSAFRRLTFDTRGASATEFALVLPLLMLLLFGMIDAGRFMWEYNSAEKATQMGVRYAVATGLVPSGLNGYSFAVSDGIPQGTIVPSANFDKAICNASTCTCTGSMCGSIGYDGAAFTSIVDRMQAMYAPITPANVQVEYRNVGIGFSGNPTGPDVSALVTVRLAGLQFQPVTCLVFPCTITMPSFSSALTLEDAAGSVSN